jgi:hypothetical protein
VILDGILLLQLLRLVRSRDYVAVVVVIVVVDSRSISVVAADRWWSSRGLG